MDLAGKHAIVVGGTSGIGLATVRQLVAAGARVTAGSRSQENIATAREAEPRASFVQIDAMDRDALEALFAEHDGFDILVNAAGVNLREPVDKVTHESWQATLTINLSVPFFLARALSGAMRERGWGRIINIASLQSRRAFPDSISYGASKAANNGMIFCGDNGSALFCIIIHHLCIKRFDCMHIDYCH